MTPHPVLRHAWELTRRFEDLWDLDHAAADAVLDLHGAPDSSRTPRRFAAWVLLHPRRSRCLDAALPVELDRVTSGARPGLAA